MAGGSEALASVHGQPVLPGGGAGSSCRLGQCIQRLFAHVVIERQQSIEHSRCSCYLALTHGMTIWFMRHFLAIPRMLKKKLDSVI